MLLHRSQEVPLRTQAWSTIRVFGSREMYMELDNSWCKELTHWKRPWCWERLKAGGEGDDRGWHGWMASQTWWTRVLASFRSSWWTDSPWGLKESDRTERLNWTELNSSLGEDRTIYICIELHVETKIPSQVEDADYMLTTSTKILDWLKPEG